MINICGKERMEAELSNEVNFNAGTRAGVATSMGRSAGYMTVHSCPSLGEDDLTLIF